MTSPHHCARLLTPHGTGAIAVIRLEGPEPLALLRKVFVHPAGRLPHEDILLHGKICDGDEVIDDCLVSWATSNSDCPAIEISCHGGVRVVQRILGLLERLGAETRETHLSNYWPAGNALETEALEALQGARTEKAVLFSGRLREELDDLIHAISVDWQSNRVAAQERMGELVDWFGTASALLHGVRVTLVGPPNSGKSTLFNTLVGRQAAITSDIPGTTRDWICEAVEFNGLPVDLIDTAGRHENAPELERLAIESGKERARESHVTVLVFDGSTELTQADWLMISSEKCAKHVVVANKNDLRRSWSAADVERIAGIVGFPPLSMCAKNGGCCDTLKNWLVGQFQLQDPKNPPVCLFTQRQVTLATRILKGDGDAQELFAALMTGPTT